MAVKGVSADETIWSFLEAESEKDKGDAAYACSSDESDILMDEFNATSSKNVDAPNHWPLGHCCLSSDDETVHTPSKLQKLLNDRSKSKRTVQQTHLEELSAEDGMEDWVRIVTDYYPEDHNLRETVMEPGMDGVTPLDYLAMFLSAEFWDLLVTETNRHAAQTLRKKKLKKGSNLRTWKDTTVAEMKAYFAILLSMGLCNTVDMQDYWSASWITVTSSISKIMSRVRFTLIRAMLHFCNDEESSSKNSQKHNRLFKVRQLIDVLVPKFSALYKPDKELAIHEMTVACNYKSEQRVRKKPIQWTDKVYALTEARTGYLLEWAIHAGSSRETEKGASIVRKLCTRYIGKHDIYINTANSYTNRNLAKEFVGQTNGSGGIPGELKTINENNNPVCAKIAVRSSAIKAKSATQKGNKRSYNDMKKANSEKRYNYLSGVIPIFRQLNLFRHKTLKWSLRIFENLAQICVVNSYILYTSKTSDSSDKMDLKKYIEACVSGLLVDYNPHITEKWRPPQPGAVLSRILPPQYVHKIIKIDKKPQCVVCSDSRRKLGRRQTSFMCEKCNVALCVVPCFHRYHTLKNYRVCHLDM